MAFQAKQPRHLPHHQVARLDPERSRQGRVRSRRGKRPHIHPAMNGLVLAGLADPGSQVLLAHRIGHRDELGRDLAGQAFGPGKQPVTDGVLVTVE